MWIFIDLVLLAIIGISIIVEYDRRKDYTPLERSLLDTLFENMEPRTAELTKEQMRNLPRKQRLYYPKMEELNLYPRKNGHMPEHLLFPHKGELKLATVTFRLKNSSEKWKAFFGACGGYLFEIVIRPNPRKFQKETAEIFKVDVENDPFSPYPVLTMVKFDDTPAFTGFLQEWANRYHLTDIYQPITSQVKLQSFLHKFTVKFPADYLALLKQTGGFRIEDCRVLGISEVYTVSLDDGNYLYLAEKEGRGMLGIVEDSTGELFYFSFEGEKKILLGKNFQEAIESMINNEKLLI